MRTSRFCVDCCSKFVLSAPCIAAAYAVHLTHITYILYVLGVLVCVVFVLAAL